MATRVIVYRGTKDTGIPEFEGRFGTHKIERVALHHSAGADAPTKAVAKRLNLTYHLGHKKLYGDGFAYHIALDNLGRIYVGRSREEVGAHVRLNNTGTFGIMVHGSFVGTKRPNFLQRRTLKALYRGDVKGFEFLGKVPWMGHQEFPNNSTECPGNLMRYLRWLRSTK